MKIAIDMQGAQSASRFRGIGRYVNDLVNSLIKSNVKHELILLFNGTLDDSANSLVEEYKAYGNAIKIIVWHGLKNSYNSNPGNKMRIDISELFREYIIEKLDIDLLVISSLFEGYIDSAVLSVKRYYSTTPTVVILYDLIPLLNKEEYLFNDRIYHDFYMERIKSIKNSDALFAISNSSKREGLDNLHPVEIVNISAGYSEKFKEFRPDAVKINQVKQKFGIRNNFILYAGATDERKNIPRLIMAYSSLSNEIKENFQLVIGGGMPPDHSQHLRSVIKSNQLNEDYVILTGYLQDDELNALYTGTSLFVFPSWHEGFGLPVLEAMVCGAPVIGSNTSSIPEIIQYESALFNPFDIESIAGTITEFLTSSDKLANLKSNSEIRSKMFSWNISAKKVWEFIDEFTNKTDIDINETYEVLDYKNFLLKLDAVINDSIVDKNFVEEVANYIVLNNIDSIQNKLYIDISELVTIDAKSGIQRVVKNLLVRFLKNYNGDQVVIPVCIANNDFYIVNVDFNDADILEFNFNVSNEVVAFSTGDTYVGLDYCPNLQSRMYAQYVKMKHIGVHISFLLHDLLPIEHPSFFPPDTEPLFKKWLSVVSLSDQVICVSQATANSYLKYLSKKNDLKPLVTVSQNGCDISQKSNSLHEYSEISDKFDGIENFTTFIMIGTLEPRKGHLQVIEAFELLWAKGFDYKLIIVGKAGWMCDHLINKIHLSDNYGINLYWLQGLSDIELESLIRKSKCLIASSYSEGFGLPIIEVAEYGIHVLARDIPVFREIAGDNISYFTSNDFEGLSLEIQDWSERFKKSTLPDSTMIKKLSWDESFANFINLLPK